MTTLLPLPFGGEGRGEGAQPFTRMTGTSSYGWIVVVGIVASIILWARVARRDRRLVIIYLAALGSAFLGAKLVYFAAEGWLHWNDSTNVMSVSTKCGSLPSWVAHFRNKQSDLAFGPLKVLTFFFN